MRLRPIDETTLCLFFLMLMTVTGQDAAAENWPRFRGNGGNGTSSLTGLPIQWSDKDYAWKTRLPGPGHSSPCVWDDHLFLTSSSDEGRTRMLLDIDVKSGDIRWTKTATLNTHSIHELSSYASGTPATDGRQVYVLFVSDKQMLIRACDFAGEQMWERDLGPFFQRESQVHGSGTSPIVFEDLVIVANQQDGPASIIALDSATGETRWENDLSLQMTAHSTPLVLQRADSPPQLFYSNKDDGIVSLNVRNGERLFRASVMNARCVGSPVIAGDLVMATCGGGGRGSLLAAMRVNSRGQIDESAAAWTRNRTLPYVPTPVAVGDYVYLWGDKGVVVCVEADSGQEIWTTRVAGDYWGSPVCADRQIYCVSVDGTVAVVAASPEFRLLGKNQLGERSHSTPAIAAGRLFIRGFEHLYCLEANTTIETSSVE